MMRKFNKYKDAGVREYWIVDGEKHLVYKSVLYSRDGKNVYESSTYGAESVPVDTLNGFTIDMAAVFAAGEGTAG